MGFSSGANIIIKNAATPGDRRSIFSTSFLKMTDWFIKADLAPLPVNYRLVLLSLLLAFVCGHVLAWVYMATQTGLSYSRSFVHSLVVMPVLVALVLMVLSNNIVTAFGLMAVLAIVRFRNVLRDTFDTTFVLAVIILGMACGAQRYATAILSCALLSTIIFYLSYSTFGTRNRYGLIVNVQWDRAISELTELHQLLNRHSRRSYRASQRAFEDRPGADLSYRLLLRNPELAELMLAELRAFPGVLRVSSVFAQEESEV